MPRIEFNVEGSGIYDIKIIKPGLGLEDLIDLFNSGHAFAVLDDRKIYLSFPGKQWEYVANIIDHEFNLDYNNFELET